MASNQSVPVEVRPVGDLAPYERNARRHPPDKIRKLANIIREFGWTSPILTDEVGIVAGHRRRLAAMLIYEEGGTIRLPGGRELPAGTVPVIDCTGWSDEQRRAYILADNQTTLEGEWDEDLLRLELTFLDGAGFDLGLTGFDGEALEAALGAAQPAPSDPDPLRVSLADRFGVPPFSVLNAREGWWQERKRAWLSLGIQSELGRGGAFSGANDDGTVLHGGGLADQLGARAIANGRKRKANAIPGGGAMPLDRAKQGKANATPGGSAMPAANYGKTKARGDGRGRAMQTEDLRGGLTPRTTTDPYRAKAKTDG